MRNRAIVLSDRDNVATALAALPRAGRIALSTGPAAFVVTMKSDIPFGHKFALTDIRKGEKVMKYGEAIGLASKPIRRGQHVHTHNVDSARGRGDMRCARRTGDVAFAVSASGKGAGRA